MVGVEAAAGPGGVPTGEEWATCLVSGGMHSAVVAWNALLSGYRLKLLHAEVTEESLKAVAMLYAEFSHRVHPGALKLEVVQGVGDVRGFVRGQARAGNRVFGGFHSPSAVLPDQPAGVMAPLYLLSEEDYAESYGSLGVKGAMVDAASGSARRAARASRKFEGWAEDVSDVLDGLR